MKKLFIIAMILSFTFTAPYDASAKSIIVRLGENTGRGMIGKEYFIGAALAVTVNKGHKEHKVRVVMQTTMGLKDNISQLSSGSIQSDNIKLAVVPSDLNVEESGIQFIFDIPTESLSIVSSSNVSEDTIYIITKAIFENIDYFKTKLKSRLIKNIEFTKGEMVPEISNSIHPGAAKYYKEAGLK